MTKGSFEPKVLKDLDNRGVSYTYEALKLNYTTTHVYTPDLVLSNGIVVELKGKFEGDDRRKMLEVRKQHPHLDIRMVFQKLNAPVVGASKRKDGSKLTCGEWARKNGFMYAETTVPKKWLDAESGEIEIEDDETDPPEDPPFKGEHWSE